jgi:hypothetical protein
MTLLYPQKKHFAGFFSLPLLFLGPILPLTYRSLFRDQQTDTPRGSGLHQWRACWEMQSTMRVAGQDRRSATARGFVRPMAHASPYSLLDMSRPPLSLRHPPHYQAVRFSSRPSHIPLHATDSATPSYRPHPLRYPVLTSALTARAFRHTMRH